MKDSSEDSDIDDDSWPEFSNEEMFVDDHNSSRLSIKSSVKKNKWKFRKQMKKFAKDKLLKHISDQEIKESALDNNPAPSNLRFRQKLDDYVLEILWERGKKNEIFSSRALVKAQENMKNNGTTGSPLGTLRSPQKR